MAAEKAEHYHGIPTAQKVYEDRSQQCITSIASMLSLWKSNPEALTQSVFWSFIQLIGKKRFAIAKECQSQDVADFGSPRGSIIIPTGAKGYSLLEKTSLELVLQPEKHLLNLKRDHSQVVKSCAADVELLGATKLTFGTLESCAFLMTSNNITEDLAYLNCYLQAVIRDQNRTQANSIYGKTFKENDRISRIFYVCLVCQLGRLAVFSDLYTCDSAAKDSPAISELYNLFKDLVSSPSPESAFAFFHKFAVTMPYKRGSSAVNEWILAAACNVKDMPMPQQSVFAEFDQTAQISTRDEFVALMMTKIA